MEIVACRLHEHSVSFRFSDGHCEEIQRRIFEHSSVIQDVLSKGHEQEVATVAAPRSYLRSWCHLRNLLASSNALENVSVSELAALLQAADFFADNGAMSKVQHTLAARLVITPKLEANPMIHDRKNPSLAYGTLKVLRCLNENLVTAVLREALDSRLLTLDDLVSLLPCPLLAPAVACTIPAVPCSTLLEIDCLKHSTSTSSAILANLSQFPHARDIHIKTMACSGARSRAARNHHSSLKRALAHAMQRSMTVSLHVVVTCRSSLERLLQRLAPDSGAVRSLQLCDGYSGRSHPFIEDTASRLSSRAVRTLRRFTGLQSLSLQDFSFATTSPAVFQALELSLRQLTGLTDLTISCSIRGTVLQRLLYHTPQLRSLDACCVVFDAQELSELETALRNLSQLSSLTLSECAWSKAVHVLLFSERWPQQPHEGTEMSRQAHDLALEELKRSKRVADSHRFLRGSIPLGNLTVPSGSPLQVLDLSKCCLDDDMMASLFLDVQRLSALQAVGFGVCKPGPNTLRALEALQTCTALTSLTLTADRAALITEDFERHLCVLKTLRALNLSNCTTRERMLDRPPLLTALTGLTELILDNCVPAAVSDETFLQGLVFLTSVVTLSLRHVPVRTFSAAAACMGALQQLPLLRDLELARLDASMLSTALLCCSLAVGRMTSIIRLSLEAPFPSGRVLLFSMFHHVRHMKCLQQLQISRMQLDSFSAFSLAQSLSHPSLSGLQRLLVKRCFFPPGAYQALISGFAAACQHVQPQYHDHLGLWHLEWSYNHLRDEDASTLAHIIARFPRLNTCSLQGLDLATAHRFRPIQHALKSLRDLQFVDLNDNGIWSARGIQDLADLARSSRQLRDLDPGSLSMLQAGCTAKHFVPLRDVAASHDPFKCVHLRDVGTTVGRMLRLRFVTQALFAADFVVFLFIAAQIRANTQVIKRERRRQAQLRNQMRAQRQFTADVQLSFLVYLYASAGQAALDRHRRRGGGGGV